MRKINKKNLLYLKASLKNEDARKVAKYREMVVTQLKDSKKVIDRLPNYKDYDILRKEYMSGLSQFIDAYENDFNVAQELVADRYNSYEDLKIYYDAVMKAEDQLLNASYRMEEADNHFAKMHQMNLVKDAEMEEEYRMLDEVTLYSRDMTLSFFRVEQHIKDFLLATNGNQDSLSSILEFMQKDLTLSLAEVANYADFDGQDNLYKQVLSFLEETQEALDDVLTPLAEELSNSFLEEKEFKKAQKELSSFISDNNKHIEDFYAEKDKLILEYLPED